ncbi:MAG: hypothetical protein AAF602_25810 [Myxococcota bacterium]
MAKRVLWGRVFGASGGTLLLGLGGWVAASPTPKDVDRRVVGPDDCSAAEVMTKGAVLVRPDDDQAGGRALADRNAAMVVLSAARCARTDELDPDALFDSFTLAWHGSTWIAAHEPAPVALGQLLDVWELAADQRRMSAWVPAAVWTGVALVAAEEVEGVLDDPSLSPGDRRLAATRLRGLAETTVDWDDVAAREERELWGRIWARTPSLWDSNVLAVPWWLYEARTQAHALDEMVRGDLEQEHAIARRLAAAAQ